MKTKEELNAIKNEVEALKNKLTELSEEEMEQVTGGQSDRPLIIVDGQHQANDPLFIVDG